MKKIAMGKVDIAGAHAWFKRASSLPDASLLDTPLDTKGNTWDFMKALVNLTLPSKSSEVVPHTFLFDEERLIKLRSDMQDLINIEICMYLYRSLESSNRAMEASYAVPDDTPRTSFVSSPFRSASPAGNSLLSSPTTPLPHHFATSKTQNIVGQERGRFHRKPSKSELFPHTFLFDEKQFYSTVLRFRIFRSHPWRIARTCGETFQQRCFRAFHALGPLFSQKSLKFSHGGNIVM
jgi:hypothetical protein